ncbi:unnamed protein product [Penicillium olsonii]|nr:unnamed protein product [Penicillium olsonii]
MEYVQNGDLQKYIGLPLPDFQAALIVAQVARALKYMHDRHFVHRDIKPLNILVSHPGPNWHVKVTDFGLSKDTQGSALGTLQIGTHGYMAPELVKDDPEHYTPAVDVWALGAVAFCLRTGNPPFLTPLSLRAYANDHKVFPIKPLQDSSAYCVDFVRHTMQDIPARRSTIDYVLTHPWLSEPGASESGNLAERPTTSDHTVNNPASNTWSSTHDNAQNPDSRSFSYSLSNFDGSTQVLHASVAGTSVLQYHQNRLIPIFGVSLQDLHDRIGPGVPLILRKCFIALEEFGLNDKTIYQLWGNSAHINQLKNAFETDASAVDLSVPENFYHDIHNVASLVKEFLRQLPEPLIPSAFHFQFINAASRFFPISIPTFASL